MTTTPDVCDALLELVRFWRAAGEPDFYEGYLAEDAVMAFHIGFLTRDEVVHSTEGAPEWKSSRSTTRDVC